MYRTFNNNENEKFEVKVTNGKYFYFSRRANRWLPVKKSEVKFEESNLMDDFNYVGSRHHY
jgi:hypothetical protein